MSRVTVVQVANKNLSPFLDDFNEPYTAVIVKKRTGTPSFCTLLISVLLLGANDSTFFTIDLCNRVERNYGFWGLLKKVYRYIPSKKWDLDSISNTSYWDKNMKIINHPEGGKNLGFT